MRTPRQVVRRMRWILLLPRTIWKCASGYTQTDRKGALCKLSSTRSDTCVLGAGFGRTIRKSNRQTTDCGCIHGIYSTLCCSLKRTILKSSRQNSHEALGVTSLMNTPTEVTH
ncbi:hypothetical protein PF005_g24362 [Phytophthora fragariae]|uniref:Secreted protein n=1 Tax=Phytophthora fragariae TaxID=53985 RepID=A0A6A3W2M1_9STRA|nr:hypothetical protein PF009_g25116 [Phytophthora fragariae]KAE9097249.1 hypothetical protein PF006_g23613 [Phytophthora fragariae]KAE9177757.1 hypothetical protein PF005_g24362 [Phytophthora fragariae]KAE9183581.1 hypothetical protein PF004_g23910 [Phytophthora fragariae]KAE9186366.1 hypothetical protein PF002_g25903 [Phytophthora fragariae]